jgi:hypothetical protein
MTSTTVPESFRKLACPNCGAPFQPDPNQAKTITCAHCGTVFERSAAADVKTISVDIADSDGVAIGDLSSKDGPTAVSVTITGSHGVAIGKGSGAIVYGDINTAGGDFVGGDKVVYTNDPSLTFRDAAAVGQGSSQPASRRRALILVVAIILAGILIWAVLSLSNWV